MRRLASVLLFLAGILPGSVYALGLGEINLHSYLNQPLDAEIKVHSASDEDLNNLIVSLAPVSEFSKIGIDFMPGLEQLKFSIEKKSDGNAIIKVKTNNTFREPFLNFLIEINWPKGRMLREYTLLIDPPVLMESKPAVTQSAVVTAPPVKEVAKETAQEVPVKEPVPSQIAKIPPPAKPAAQEQQEQVKAEPSSMDAGSPDSYGRTKRNDTLWTIAKKVRPDKSVSLNQAMIGLLRENPEAFIGNNINRLKAGYILQVPDRAAMTSMSRVEARNEVNQQYREWKNLGRKTSVAKSTDEAAETSARVPSPKKVAKGRLELLAPKTGDESRAEAGTKIDKNASNEELRRQLAFTRESEEAKSQESAELSSRVLELEEQIENINRLASLKDDQLAALQSKLAELQRGETQTGAEEPVKAEVKQAKPVKQPPPAPQPKQEPGLFDWLDDPVMLGVAGVVILIVLILLVIIARRRTSTVGFKESILQERAPVVEPSEPPVHINEVLDSKVQEQEESEDKGEEAPPPPSSSYLSDFAVSSIGSMHEEAGEADPLTEADVFLAYGRFQPAEAMINEAIESQPDRSDLRFKLLEIYYAARNESSFEQGATAFQEMVADDPIWEKVVEMGQDLCPDSVLFGGSGSSSAEPAPSDSVEEPLEPESEVQSELEEAVPESPTDEQVEEGEADEVSVGHFSASEFDTKLNSAIEEQPVNDSPIDFDLGDFEVEGEEGQAEASDSEAKSDDNLDFDLGGSEGEQVADDLASELESMASNLDSESPEGADDVGVASVMDVADSEKNMDFDLGGETPASEDLANDLEAMASNLDSEEAGDSGVASIMEVETDNDQNPDSELDTSTPSAEDLDSGNQVEEGLADDLEAMASNLDMGTDIEEEGSTAGVEIPNIDADFEFDTVDSTLSDGGEDSPLSDEDDEMGTKLDLARAYVDMGDPEGAKSILNEVVEEGDDQQKNEAQELLQKIV